MAFERTAAPAADTPPAASTEKRFKPGELAKLVSDWLATHRGPALASTIADAVGADVSSVHFALRAMAERGEVRRDGRPACWSLSEPVAEQKPANVKASPTRQPKPRGTAVAVVAGQPAPIEAAPVPPRDASVLELLVHLGFVSQAQVDAARTLLQGAA